MPYHASWRSPSNIALIKYWGKHGLQLPRNPSLSFTLSACHTNMSILVTPETPSPEVLVLYDGIPRPAFEPKIKSLFSRIQDELPWLKNASVTIDSHNTFPHSAGIASSASAMSALALCLADVDDQMNSRLEVKDKAWWKRVSGFARLGSGSACRSVYPHASAWGVSSEIPESSDSYAIPWSEQLSRVFRDYQDTILIVSTKEKSVSSTSGHEMMSALPYAETRYAVARNNFRLLIQSLQTEKDLTSFISVCESEALQLHALMMCGDTPFILMEPNTVAIIKEVWRFRNETNVPVCFTLDAGPNVHLLYPAAHKSIVMEWINNNLLRFCADGQYILDHVGSGPEKLL